MRVLFLGDSHGDLGFINFSIIQAKKFDCDRLFVLGDFGYWVHTGEGVKFLHKLRRMLQRENLTLYWLDGNHENHSVLRELHAPGAPDHRVDSDGFWIIADNIHYAPRGHRWTWDGVSFLACGGAFSIDKGHRREGSSWWPEEMITEEEVERCIQGGPVDVCLFHDVPEGVDIQLQFAIKGKGFFKADSNTAANRERLRRIVNEVQPQAIFSGHYHHRFSYTLDLWDHQCRGEVLDCNMNHRQAILPVDLSEGSPSERTTSPSY